MTRSPTTGIRPRTDVEADPHLRAGQREGALEQHAPSPRAAAAPRPDRGRSAAGPPSARTGPGSIAHQGRSAIRFTAGCRANVLGRKPVSRGETSDQRTGAVSGMNGARSVRIRSAIANCALALGRPRRQPGGEQRLVGGRIADRADIAGEVAQIPAGEIGRRDLVDEAQVGRRVRGRPARPRRRSAASRGADGRRPAGSPAPRASRPAPAAALRGRARRSRARRARGASAAAPPAQSGWAGVGQLLDARARRRLVRGARPRHVERRGQRLPVDRHRQRAAHRGVGERPVAAR